MVDRRWLALPAAVGVLVACGGGAVADRHPGGDRKPNLGEGPELTWSPDGAIEVDVDLDELPEGDAPAVAYVVRPEGSYYVPVGRGGGRGDPRR